MEPSKVALRKSTMLKKVLNAFPQESLREYGG
jgi:hypothetical protein